MSISSTQSSITPALSMQDAGGPIIRIEGVTKLYARTDASASSLKESLLQTLWKRSSKDVVAALDDVSLEVCRGEAVGLIGLNGSGKSTLLKLVAGISRPTRGLIQVSGRVLGLIELGAGFHPDLTGEENIRLQGSIYGMTRREVEGRIETILDFAELQEFRHVPVKHYSSGMYVRLGFAIAVQAAPEILLVDEVLSVGDQRFQDRCLAEIARMRREGMTLLFVTHFPDQAERVCDRLVWLDHGRLVQVGPAATVTAAYHADVVNRQYAQSEGPMTPERLTTGLPGRFGNGKARIEAVRLMDGSGQPRSCYKRGQAMIIEIDYTAGPGIEEVDYTLPLDFSDGSHLTFWQAARDGQPGRPVEGKGRFRIHVPDPPLLPGRYELTLALSPPGNIEDHYDVLYRLYRFSIEPDASWDTVAPIELTARGEVS